MNLFEKLVFGCRCLFDKNLRWKAMYSKGFFRDLPDEEFLRRMYRAFQNKELNLDDPKTFCEKLQWLKLHDRRPEYTMMVDKIAAKQWVKETAGEEYVIPMYGAWERFDDIDFDALPDRFVLKCAHDSGSVVVCRDKKTFDIAQAKKTLDYYMQRDPFSVSREWPYKNVPHRILAEKFMDGLGGKEDVEYKLTCFDGRVRLFTVCRGIPHASFEERTNDHYDREGNPLKFYAFYKNADPPVPMPPEKDEIIALAEKLSAGIPQVRVDCYVIDGQVYFGEMTFYTWGGMIDFQPPEWDEIMGSWLTLPEKS